MKKFLHYFNVALGVICTLFLTVLFGGMGVLMLYVGWTEFTTDNQHAAVPAIIGLLAMLPAYQSFRGFLSVVTWRYEGE